MIYRLHDGAVTIDNYRSTMNRTRQLGVGLCVLTAAIVGASVVPIPGAVPSTDPTGQIGVTTLAHIAGYGLLAAGGIVYAARSGWSPSKQSPQFGQFVLVVALVSALGVGTELAQAAIPWRHYAVEEMVLNGVSALGGGLLAVGLGRFATDPSR